ncbi:DNA mismatch repair endonuclease MutL [Algibacter amylolyticus]|uniref:DNA mismatch repair protein MutL n=1 Tax=Algibacter amylolyticus TaxID=1608400 RepID=A0A5M7BD96_9FLAO|nr:DNA mismatch repair endonuclease MutL [Algibacter amylolyticus]KAA5825105.1 DNA mismatch repair endonuclease MutL [Algibacter amylolyticus]MBB5268788.1 DNA mismatch repair protein MutL [Algibacter amylolyticus]TSJ77599.1 DNA mismatch repair endonuclease MutL [Algibacter amylolyticus]
MADIIQLLPDHVANQIAAGEVVQRPASVVKELLENAIDAGADTIKLIIKDAGKTLVQVIDNGKGMSTTDARLSFERHATSKIRSAEDLFQLHTKGFRGEALASIAAIAHVELKTKQETDDVGNVLVIEGSNITSQDVVVTPTGTSVSVKNLFFNIPARRNFLKSDTVELRHIIDEFHRVALAHPGISFALYNNGSESFNLPISNYRHRIVNIFGAKTNEKLVPVEEDTEVLNISGFVGKPEFAKKTRGEQYFFVNNRFIKSAYLNHAIASAFEGLLKTGTHASYFLNLTVDPQTIDINIHPTKTEIKFDDEHTLYALLRSAVKHSLGQFNIAPVLDFDRDPNLDTPYSYKKTETSVPKVEVDRSFNPFQEEKTSQPRVSNYKKEPTESWESLYVGLESKGNHSKQEFSAISFESEERTASIFDDDKQVEKTHTTYQLHNKYIVSTIKSGMMVIDQHRAHQRVLYEDFLKNLTVKEAASQQLLFPLQLHFSPQDIVIINQLKVDLEHTGFVFSSVMEELVEITGVPVGVPESEVSIILEQLVSDVENEVPESHFSASDLLAKSMAKSLAIKTGQSLQKDEQEHLVNKLFACKEPNVSPTNRTTFITMSVDELDKKFI